MTMTTSNAPTNKLIGHKPTTRPGNLFTEKVSDEFHCNHETGYKVPQVTLGAPENRRLKVRCIGAGISGIMLAYEIEKQCSNIDFAIYEKNADVGGTWVQNRYPNAACDTPSHGYQFNFALNPEWPTFFSNAPTIQAYIADVVDSLELRKYMTFNSTVTRAVFDENLGVWNVDIKSKQSDGSSKTITESCDLLVGAIGLFDRWELPKIPGLEKFKGRVLHTAGWDPEYGQEQWKDDRIAVIGAGASAIQIVPGLQPYAKKIDLMVRSGIWFFAFIDEKGNEFPGPRPYTEDEKSTFRNDHTALLAHAKFMEEQLMKLFWIMIKNGAHTAIREQLYARMREHIKDERLLKGFLPDFSVGCKRVTPGDALMTAVQQENVSCHFTGVKEVTETGLIGEDGSFVETDTIICATGFDVSYRPPFPLIGLNGTDLRDKWETTPDSYFGVACPEMPNWINFVGPTFPVENGSAMGAIDAVVKYTLKIIKKMQAENIKYWVPRQDITDDFNDHVQTWYKGTVWGDDCHSWYRNKKTGRVDAIWPGSTLHFMEALDTPRYEDFDIKYHHPTNRFNFLGHGFAPRDMDFSPEADRSPYLTLDKLDPRYYERSKLAVRQKA